MMSAEPKKQTEPKETKEPKVSKEQKDSKRKAIESPEQDKQPFRLRRRGSLPDLQEFQSASEQKKWEIMRKGLFDPDTTREFVPLITKQLQPSIELSIESAIERSMQASITRAVNSALHKFKSEVMDPMLERNATEINDLKSQIEQKDNQIKNLEQSNTKMAKPLMIWTSTVVARTLDLITCLLVRVIIVKKLCLIYLIGPFHWMKPLLHQKSVVVTPSVKLTEIITDKLLLSSCLIKQRLKCTQHDSVFLMSTCQKISRRVIRKLLTN